LFQTLTSIAEKVDPVKVNLTLSAAAQALCGLGDTFGGSLVNGNAILDDINSQLGGIQHDIQRLADLSDTYANASPHLWDFLADAVRTARTLTRRQDDLDEALLAAVGLANNGVSTGYFGHATLTAAAGRSRPTGRGQCRCACGCSKPR
jgi:phospholipid/cholesterol/gamma-HCH transport system substrate-binding protein